MADIEIRQVTEVSPDLVETWQRLLPQLSKSAVPLTAEALKGVVEGDATTMFEAVSDNQTVGYLTLAAFPTPTGIRAWIYDVVVDEAARGQGVGAQLTKAAIARAEAIGARTIDLTSRPSREAANRLYQRAGFSLRESTVYRYTINSDK